MNTFFLKTLSWTMMMIVVLSLSGCATMKKKFIRRKKVTPAQPQVYTQKEYVKPYSNAYYYKSHYAYWRSWHQDLMKLLDGNQKRLRMATEEVRKQLEDMHQYLMEEQAQALMLQMEEVFWALDQLEASKANAVSSRVRFKLEKGLRVIQSQFAPSDMKDHIKPDKIEL